MPSHVLVAVLCLFIGVTAIGGGVALVLDPTGSRTQLPLALLRHSPFPSYLVPGLLLSVVVGVSNTIAGLLELRRHSRARTASLTAGVVLVVWIVCEMLLLRTIHWLQLLYLGFGVLVIAESLAPTRRR